MAVLLEEDVDAAAAEDDDDAPLAMFEEDSGGCSGPNLGLFLAEDGPAEVEGPLPSVAAPPAFPVSDT